MPKLDLDNLGPKDGLHRLKDLFGQKSGMGILCEFITEHFDSILAATIEAAPAREQFIEMNRLGNENIDSSERERLWEREIANRWKTDGITPVKGTWHRIVSHQVPLFDSKKKKGWGYIDLLGVDKDCTPCVIELKKETSTETPLRMILEATAYAVALRKIWPLLVNNWNDRLKQLGISTTETTKMSPKPFNVIALAPASFWLDWLPVTKRGKNEINAKTWDSFSSLLEVLRKHEFHCRFVSISGAPELPNSLELQALDCFPPDFKAASQA